MDPNQIFAAHVKHVNIQRKLQLQNSKNRLFTFTAEFDLIDRNKPQARFLTLLSFTRGSEHYFGLYFKQQKRDILQCGEKASQVPFWMQKSATEPLSPVVWDYHVLLLRKTVECSLVYDLDSILAFPCPFQQYIQQAIQSERQLKKQFHRKFRVIPAQTFLQTFASDRSHMKKPNGKWLKTPPDYPPIRTADCTMNLSDFIGMTSGDGEGEVLNQENFIARFTEFS